MLPVSVTLAYHLVYLVCLFLLPIYHSLRTVEKNEQVDHCCGLKDWLRLLLKSLFGINSVVELLIAVFIFVLLS